MVVSELFVNGKIIGQLMVVYMFVLKGYDVYGFLYIGKDFVLFGFVFLQVDGIGFSQFGFIGYDGFLIVDVWRNQGGQFVIYFFVVQFQLLVEINDIGCFLVDFLVDVLVFKCC